MGTKKHSMEFTRYICYRWKKSIAVLQLDRAKRLRGRAKDNSMLKLSSRLIAIFRGRYSRETSKRYKKSYSQ